MSDHRDSMVSYGVRNSMAAYMSLSAGQDARSASRKKKSRSMYALPNSNMDSLDYDDEEMY